MSAIGYRECVRVIEGEWSIEQAKVGDAAGHACLCPPARQLVQGIRSEYQMVYAGGQDTAREIEAYIRTILHD